MPSEYWNESAVRAAPVRFIGESEEGEEPSERENGLVGRVPTHRPPARRSCRLPARYRHGPALAPHPLTRVRQLHPHLEQFRAMA
ncbi:hypothetical protein E2C01_046955 [Portunus trituberculatus]|uniref:Uncharacterized protein n=1 Tax=Portunus trituberculatus TaxID=210409 RepID=A0A5B7G2B4_PORTR|nr:hypothetical protein [Portunus trituberculatus]